jgi:hypothetical protein
MPNESPTPKKFGGSQPGSGRKKIGPVYRVVVPEELKAQLIELGAARVRVALEQLCESEKKP